VAVDLEVERNLGSSRPVQLRDALRRVSNCRLNWLEILTERNLHDDLQSNPVLVAIARLSAAGSCAAGGAFAHKAATSRDHPASQIG
jgi:hypothetical protein